MPQGPTHPAGPDVYKKMIFAGLQKNTLIDYPGKVACVVFLTGCNFTCPYCHNPELARGRWPQRISRGQFLDFLIPRKKLLDGVAISGGEPTLHPELADLCRRIHDLDLPVKLDTNGSRPEILEQLFDNQLVDYVAMDIKTAIDRYAPPLAPTEVSPAVEKSIQLIMTRARDYEFRTTCVRPFVDEAIMPQIASSIRGARRYVLQPYRSETILRPAFFSDSRAGGFSSQQMAELKAIAAPHVETCIVRE